MCVDDEDGPEEDLDSEPLELSGVCVCSWVFFEFEFEFEFE